jgi:hypothetical protein
MIRILYRDERGRDCVAKAKCGRKAAEIIRVLRERKLKLRVLRGRR